MPTIRTLGGGTRTETMPDSNSAHEPIAYDGPQAPMTLREIAEAFVADPDADVVGVIEHILKVKSASINHAGLTVMHMADHIIDFVEGQR